VRAPPAPAGRATRAAGAGRVQSRARSRWVRRRVRHIDAHTVVLISLLFYLGLLAVALVAGVIIWQVAVAAGAIHHLQSFIVRIGFARIHHLGSRVLHFAVYVGLVLVGIGTVVNAILAVVYNLVADLVGGVGVIFEERDSSGRSAR
jgi:uncharacterized membrane protein